MANRSHVPKFGNWESGENVPYTVYFDKARKGKTGGKMINPNDPQENPGLFSEDTPSFEAPTLNAGIEPAVKVGQGGIRSKSEDGDFRQTDSPVRHESAGHRATTESSHQRYGDRVASSGESRETPKRPAQQSPLHPHYQPKSGNKGSAISSPSYERRSSESIQGLAPNTPGRSRLRSAVRGDETPDKSTAVPKFGEWDENNPASADGFTHIFNKVREEKQSGAGNVSPMPKNSYSDSYSNQGGGDGKGCGCFSWLSKK